MSFLKKLTHEEPEDQTDDDEVEDVPGTLERLDRLEGSMTRLEIALRTKEAELVTLRGLVQECPRCSKLVTNLDRKRKTLREKQRAQQLRRSQGSHRAKGTLPGGEATPKDEVTDGTKQTLQVEQTPGPKRVQQVKGGQEVKENEQTPGSEMVKEA